MRYIKAARAKTDGLRRNERKGTSDDCRLLNRHRQCITSPCNCPCHTTASATPAHVIINSTVDTPGTATYRCACGKRATFAFLAIAGHHAECDGQHVKLAPNK